ncbi:MAG TPA: hypothetical protein VH374_23245 [Polyangia bacterium]|nr:hypothetical protein [Polyangia bacterium]
MEYPVKQIPAAGVGGLLGGVFCLATAAVGNATGLGPNFPAFGGEDDFSLRFTIFGAVILPLFVVFGSWIGLSVVKRSGSWSRAVIGATIGTTVAGVIGRAFAALSHSRHDANKGLVAFFAIWVIFSGLGALIAFRFKLRRW